MLVSLGVSRDFTTAASEVKGQRHRGTASKGGGEGGRRGGDISLGRNGQLNRLRTQKVTVEVIRHKSPSSAGRFFSSSSALFFFLLFLPTPPPHTHTLFLSSFFFILHYFVLLFSTEQSGGGGRGGGGGGGIIKRDARCLQSAPK